MFIKILFVFVSFELPMPSSLHLLIFVQVLLVYRILVGVLTPPPLPRHLALLCELCGTHTHTHTHPHNHKITKLHVVHLNNLRMTFLGNNSYTYSLIQDFELGKIHYRYSVPKQNSLHTIFFSKFIILLACLMQVSVSAKWILYRMRVDGSSPGVLSISANSSGKSYLSPLCATSTVLGR